MRSLDGKPVRVKPGCADRMNMALEILGIGHYVSQTATTLTIGKTKINCPRTYETSKSIDFDNKIRAALRELLKSNSIDMQNILDAHKAINNELEQISPRYGLGGMGYYASTSEMENWLQKAEAVKEFYAQEKVKETMKLYDAINRLFKNDWDEVIN